MREFCDYFADSADCGNYFGEWIAIIVMIFVLVFVVVVAAKNQGPMTEEEYQRRLEVDLLWDDYESHCHHNDYHY